MRIYAKIIGYCASQIEGKVTVYRSRITDKLQAERTVAVWKAENPNLDFEVEAIYSSSKNPLLLGYCKFSALEDNGSVVLEKEHKPGHFAVFAYPYVEALESIEPIEEINKE